MNKVLVTGATGFIGRYIIERLLKEGFTVIATSSNKQTAAEKSWFTNVMFIPFDLKTFDDEVNYFDFFDKPDILIHLAWEGLPNYIEDFHVSENLPRHYAFLKNLVTNGLKNINVTGTCLEYGMLEGCLNEEMEVKPTTSYGIAKNELRIKLQKLSEDVPFNFKWMRLFYMFGNGQNPKSLISQLDKALESNEEEFKMSGGKQIRDFLPVETVAEYIVKAANQDVVTGIINCCSGEPITVYDFIINYLEEKNKSIKLKTGYYPYTSYEPMEFWGDTKKLKLITDL